MKKAKFLVPNLKKISAPFIGVDEVGRGCIAGPVVAAAVILNSDHDTHLYVDSKKINENQREELNLSIRQHHTYSIGWASVEEVDELNILQASLLAMHRAVSGLKLKKGSVLVDGREYIPNLPNFDQYPVIKGDSLLSMISAASIVAKVERDQFMKNLAREYSAYGFEKHKGYGTAVHRNRIQEVGPCRWHRKSFGGVKEHLGLARD